MEVLGIHKLVFGVQSLADTDCLSDIGLSKISDNIYRTLNGSTVECRLGKPGLLEVVWAVTGISETSEFTDNQIKHVFDPKFQFTKVEDTSVKTNSFSQKNRINQQVPIVDETNVCGIAHIALYSSNIEETISNFSKVGFIVSDSIKNRSVFLRSKGENPHHQLLVMYSPEKTGFQHVAFNAKDMYNVVTKGLSLSSKGYKTVLGPGRHVISSSMTWYFETMLGLFEVTSDEDYLTTDWTPTEYDPEVSIIYEWAIENGLNHVTRRQKETIDVTKFIEQKLK